MHPRMAFAVLAIGLYEKRYMLRKLFHRFKTSHGTELIRFGDIVLTLEDLFSSLLCTGGTGSGKSSSLKLLARRILEERCGLVVTAAKVSEIEDWMVLIRKAGRERDVRRISFERDFSIGILSHELNRPGSSVESCCQLISKLIDVGNRDQSDGRGEESYFRLGTELAARRTLQTVHLAKGTASFQELYDCLTSAAKTPEQAASPEWLQRSACGRLLKTIEAKTKTTIEQELFSRLMEFWLCTWPNTADRTRSCFEAGCTNVWGRFLDEPFASLFSTKRQTITSEEVCEHQAIWLLDMPVLKWGLVGKLAQFALSCLVQECCLRRIETSGNPVILWRDECQFFVHPGHDTLVTTVSRSHRLGHLDIVQDFDVLTTAFGGSEKAKIEADAFAAQHMTRLMFSSTNINTNELQSRLIGSKRELLFSGGSERDPNPGFLDDLMGCTRVATVSWSEQYQPLIRPEFFSTGLKKGGLANNRQVDAILFQGGKRFENGLPYRLVTFTQGAEHA
jgi:hypothetical protein